MIITNMKNQEALLKSIRNKIPKSASLIEEIASVLEISYDASHRRISEKSTDRAGTDFLWGK